MYSVTYRVKQTKQPRGGYLPVSNMIAETFDDGYKLAPMEDENIHPALVGLAVDYLFRFVSGESAEFAFFVSLEGASRIGETRLARKLVNNIRGLDAQSIVCACKLSGFDVCVRSSPSEYVPVQQINANEATVKNIQIMVRRCMDFFHANGPIIQTGPSFEGAYTDVISSGDADYLTCDTLWDLKVSKSSPTSKHTLQLLVYYIMGKHSIHSVWNQIHRVGIFNPRRLQSFVYSTDSLPSDLIEMIEQDVIGYGSDYFNKMGLPNNTYKIVRHKKSAKKRMAFVIIKGLIILFFLMLFLKK